MLTTTAPLVRWMQATDIPSLVELFAESFAREHWLPQDFTDFAMHPNRDNRIKVLVDESDRSQQILAAIAVTLTAEECCVRRLAVPRELRRQGHATYLLNQVAGRQSVIQRRIFTAVVPETNLAAQLFFRDSSVGFRFDAADRRWLANGHQGYVFRFLKTPRRRRATARI